MKQFSYTNIMAIVAISFSVAHMASCGIVEKKAVGIIETDIEVTDVSATDAGSDTANDAPKDATETDAPEDAIPPAVVYKDDDGDGVTSKIDCDDKNKDIFPGAKEVCNNVDDDCDGKTDEGLWETVFDDLDGDGYGDPKSGHITCNPKSSLKWVSNYTDCNDSTEVVDGKVVGYFINPGRAEVCGDKIDNDCNGKTDEGVTYFIDSDSDGFGDPLQPAVICGEKVAAMYVSNNTDCNDSNKGVHPGAEELCDEVDNDCDGLFDEPFANIGEACQPEVGGATGIYVCSANKLAQWCEPDLTQNPGQGETPVPPGEEFVPFYELAVYWPNQSTATISYQVYSGGEDIGKEWTASKKSVYYFNSPNSGFVSIKLEGMNQSTCGVRFNVAFNEPADNWLCEVVGADAGKIKSGAYFWIGYFEKPDTAPTVVFNEKNAYVWMAPEGGCSLLFVKKTNGKCALD